MNRKYDGRGSLLRRRLDFCCGVPLLRVLSWIRRFRVRHMDTGVGPVGFLRTAAIGDTVMLSAILRDARQCWPRRRLVVFLGESNLALGPMLGDECEVVAISIKRPLGSLLAIRKQGIELMLDFGPWPRLDALLACGSGAAVVAGFSTPAQHRHHAYDATAGHRADVHELENCRALARAVGLEPKLEPAVQPSKSFPLPPELSGRWVAFHPWPGGFRSELREWPLEAWVELAGVLSKNGLKIGITGGPTDVRRQAELIEKLRTVVSGAQVWPVRGRSLEEVAFILKSAVAMVSVNTGIMHMAAALGVPVVSLNGPTSTLRWGPVGPHTRSVEPEGGGGGYLHLGFEYDATVDLHCMARIHVGDVVSALVSLGVIGRS